MKKLIVAMLIVLFLVAPVCAYEQGWYRVQLSGVGWCDGKLWAKVNGLGLTMVWVQCPPEYYRMLETSMLYRNPIMLFINESGEMECMFLELDVNLSSRGQE